jgi:CRP-like cAMP-binding protein
MGLDATTTAATWGNAPVLAGINESTLKLLSEAGEWRDVAAGTQLISEGAESGTFYIICAGSVEVLKAAEDGTLHRLNVLGPGETLGEPALLAAGQRKLPATRAMASVVALEPVRLFGVSIAGLVNEPRFATARDALLRNTARLLVGRMSDANETTAAALLQALNRQRMFAAYLVNLILVYSLFALSLFALGDLVRWFGDLGWSPDAMRSLHSVVFIVLLFMGTRYCLSRANVSATELGAHPPRWRADLATAALWSLPMLAVMAGLRAHLYPAEQLLSPYLLQRGPMGSWASELGLAVLYFGLMCWMQEYVARIGLQAMLLHNLLSPGRAAALQAITVSALGFATFHALFGLQAVLVTFALGLYLGLMFHLYRSLVAVSMCHIIAGASGFYLFGLLR